MNNKTDRINGTENYLATIVMFILFGGIIGAATYVSFIPQNIRTVLKAGMAIVSLVAWFILNRDERLQQYKQIAIGFFVALPSFAIPAMLEKWINNGAQPTIWWQMLAYWFITAGEVLISIPSLEFAYTQAPKSMKSLISSLYLLAVSLGNLPSKSAAGTWCPTFRTAPVFTVPVRTRI